MILVLASSCTTYRPEEDFFAASRSAAQEIAYIPGVPDLDRLRRKDSVAAVNALARFWDKKPLERPSDAVSREPGFEIYPVDDVIQTHLIENDLWSFAFYGTLDAIQERLERDIPILVMVQDNALNVETRRYMILVGINADGEQILVHEGGPSPGVYNFRHFRKIWWPVRNWMMVICPPERAAWDMRMLEVVALARYQEKRGNWEQAIRDYRRAADADPENLSLKLVMADALYNSGDALGAIALYRAVLEADDLNARAANNLAYVLAETHADLGEAERLVRRALSLEPSNPVYLDTLGHILIKAGRHREAARVLSRAEQRMDRMPVSAQRRIIDNLISALESSNQSHLARQVLDIYRRKDPGFNPPGTEHRAPSLEAVEPQ